MHASDWVIMPDRRQTPPREVQLTEVQPPAQLYTTKRKHGLAFDDNDSSSPTSSTSDSRQSGSSADSGALPLAARGGSTKKAHRGKGKAVGRHRHNVASGYREEPKSSSAAPADWGGQMNDLECAKFRKRIESWATTVHEEQSHKRLCVRENWVKTLASKPLELVESSARNQSR